MKLDPSHRGPNKRRDLWLEASRLSPITGTAAQYHDGWPWPPHGWSTFVAAVSLHRRVLSEAISTPEGGNKGVRGCIHHCGMGDPGRGARAGRDETGQQGEIGRKRDGVGRGWREALRWGRQMKANRIEGDCEGWQKDGRGTRGVSPGRSGEIWAEVWGATVE